MLMAAGWCPWRIDKWPIVDVPHVYIGWLRRVAGPPIYVHSRPVSHPPPPDCLYRPANHTVWFYYRDLRPRWLRNHLARRLAAYLFQRTDGDNVFRVQRVQHQVVPEMRPVNARPRTKKNKKKFFDLMNELWWIRPRADWCETFCIAILTINWMASGCVESNLCLHRTQSYIFSLILFHFCLANFMFPSLDDDLLCAVVRVAYVRYAHDSWNIYIQRSLPCSGSCDARTLDENHWLPAYGSDEKAWNHRGGTIYSA